ncbi:hypothetical protein BKA62DRAFT_332219 [Auriculariales sp. MPI-PUGE-AT-0066]|nr:hypothetical protein BKA62DRAFT_332219 [Auriculariales sp. MPI-PUGE-AT-0066]
MTTPTTRAHPPGTHTHVLERPSEAEKHNVALIAARAFTTHPTYLWFAGVNRPGFAPPSPTAKSSKDIPQPARSLYFFFRALINAVFFSGGRIVVVRVPDSAPLSASSSPHPLTSSNSPGRIVAIAIWLAPGFGESLDSPLNIYRLGFHRPVLGRGSWGLGAVKRLNATRAEYERLHETGVQKRGIKGGLHACWTCELLGTEPDEEGKGYASLLMREGLVYLDSLPTPPPCILEANSPRLKAIYERFGFEGTAEVRAGTGKVDGDGFRVARGGSPSDALGVYTVPMVVLTLLSGSRA